MIVYILCLTVSKMVAVRHLGYVSLRNFIKVDQKVAEIWQFIFFKMVSVRNRGFPVVYFAATHKEYLVEKSRLFLRR